MVTDKFKAYILVSIQGISIVLILVTGWPLSGYVPLLIIQIAGAMLGIWAIVVMGRKNTNIPFLSPSRGTRHPPSKRYLLSLTLSIVARALGSGRQGYKELRHGLRPDGPCSPPEKRIFCRHGP
jgi:hypothetical protein